MVNNVKASVKTCLKCGSETCKVVDTREKDCFVRRQRMCCLCGYSWFTVEITEGEYTNLIKSDERNAAEALDALYSYSCRLFNERVKECTMTN